MAASDSYEKLGNVLHSVILAAGLLYAACVVYFTQPGKLGFVDEGWKEDGFCIHNKYVPYWSSFDTCLYVDVFFSAVLGVLYLSWRKRLPEHCSETVPMVIASTVGHGIAHGAMALSFRNNNNNNNQEGGLQQQRDITVWQSIAFCAFFWFPLLKASLASTTVSYTTVAILAIVVTYGPLLLVDGGLPKEHGFAYVQTIVTLAFHISQLLLDSKAKQRREYLTLPLIAALPPIITSWNEALGCNAYFRNLGGHMLYDASIIIGFLVYYVDCYRHHVLLLVPVGPPWQKEKAT